MTNDVESISECAHVGTMYGVAISAASVDIKHLPEEVQEYALMRFADALSDYLLGGHEEPRTSTEVVFTIDNEE